MKKKYFKNIIIPLDFLSFSVDVIVSDDLDLINRHIENKHHIDSMVCFNFDGRTAGSDINTIVNIYNYDEGYILPGTIAHECSHAVKKILRFIGESRKTIEVDNYLLGYLVDETFKFCIKNKIKIGYES